MKDSYKLKFTCGVSSSFAPCLVLKKGNETFNIRRCMYCSVLSLNIEPADFLLHTYVSYCRREAIGGCVESILICVSNSCHIVISCMLFIVIPSVELLKAVSDLASQLQASWYLTPRWERRAVGKKEWSIMLRSPKTPRHVWVNTWVLLGGPSGRSPPSVCCPPLSWLGNMKLTLRMRN